MINTYPKKHRARGALCAVGKGVGGSSASPQDCMPTTKATGPAMEPHAEMEQRPTQADRQARSNDAEPQNASP